jgi:hypothetical protein
MQIIPANNPDTGAAITEAVTSGERHITLAAGYHRFATPAWLPAGVKLTAFGAHCELVGLGFSFDGVGILIRGGTFFGGLSAAFGAIASNASSVSLERCRIEVTVGYSGLVVNALNCTFAKPPGASSVYASGFRDGVVEHCSFIEIDTYVGGSVTFRHNTMRNARLVSNQDQGGLKGATFQNIRWDNKRSLTNEGECFLFENTSVVDCVFDNLRYEGCSGPLFMFYGWTGSFNFTGNKISNMVSTGPTSFGIFLLTGGAIANNTFRGISLHRIHYPIMLGQGVKASNKFDMIYINDVTPVVPSDGFESLWVDQIQSFARRNDGYRVYQVDNTDPARRTVIMDYGDGRSQFGLVRINKAGGTPVCNRSIPSAVVRA